MKKTIDIKLFIKNNEVNELVVLKYGKTSSQFKKTTNRGLIKSMSERYKSILQNFSLLSIIGFPCTSLELKSLRNSIRMSVVLRRKDDEVNKRYSLYLRYFEMTDLDLLSFIFSLIILIYEN